MYVLCMLRQPFVAVVCTCTRPTHWNSSARNRTIRILPLACQPTWYLHYTRSHRSLRLISLRRLRLVGLAVTTMPLLPVPDDLEATDDLTNAEETKDLSGDDTGAPVLCARCAADLREDGVGVHAVGQLVRVAEGVERGLEVALDGLDGAVAGVRNAEWRDLTWAWAWAYGGAMLRCWTISLPTSRPTRP